MRKVIIGMVVGAILCLSVSTYASTKLISKTFFNNTTRIFVNGDLVDVEIVHAVKEGETAGRNYVSVKDLAEALGARVRWDGKSNTIVITTTQDTVVNYEDGTYRGMFADRGDIQVAVEFVLKNNIVEKIEFRQLFYGKIDYRTEKEDATVIGLRKQHEQLIKHLVGKDIRKSLSELYNPGDIVVENVDAFTGATLRSGKIISSVRDALNRGVYKY